MERMKFPTAPRTAAAIGGALARGEIEAADRLLTELVGRVINAPGAIPTDVTDKPASTGDVRYDTLLAVGLSYALALRGLPVAPWMEETPALDREWLWDGDDIASLEFRAYIRRHTPPMFLAKGLLLRAQDLEIQ